MKNVFFILFSLFLVACGADVARPKESIIKNIPLAAPVLPADVMLVPDGFTQRVFVEFGEGKVVLSQLPAGVTADVNGAALFLRSQVAGVEYVVRGKSRNSSFVLVSEYSPLLTLDSLEISSVGGDAFTVSSKEKIFIRGSYARLEDVVAETALVEKQAATLSLMGDAVFCDGVRVVVSAARRDAVRSTGIVYVDDASIEVPYATACAINATKGVVLAEGGVTATALKDVIKVKQGNFIMLGGSLSITATADKADALVARNIYIYEGCAKVDVAGAAAKGLKSKDTVFLLGGTLDVHTSGGALFSEKKSDYSSSSCIKSGRHTYINKVRATLVSDGDAGKGINCDGLLQIDGGSLFVKTTGDGVDHPIDLNAHASAKGIKCDSTILVRGGEIEVFVCGVGGRLEGVESKGDIIISGADASLYVCAYDDAINSGGDFILDAGKVFVFSATNDGVDSNAGIFINGGVLLANGSHSPEQGVDCDFERDFTMLGGTLVSLGGAIGQAPVLPKNASTEAVFVAWSGVDVEKGFFVNLADEAGEVLLSYRLPRSLRGASLAFSHPSMEKGAHYTLFMSDAIEGGTSVGCGLYSSSQAVPDGAAATWCQEGLLAVVTSKGEKLFINPDTIKSVASGSLPAFPPQAGTIPPPPLGGFPKGAAPPPSHAAFEAVSSMEEFPNEGW